MTYVATETAPAHEFECGRFAACLLLLLGSATTSAVAAGKGDQQFDLYCDGTMSSYDFKAEMRPDKPITVGFSIDLASGKFIDRAGSTVYSIVSITSEKIVLNQDDNGHMRRLRTIDRISGKFWEAVDTYWVNANRYYDVGWHPSFYVEAVCKKLSFTPFDTQKF